MTEAQERVMDVIMRWQRDYKNSPSPQDIGREIGRAKTSVYRTLYRLQKAGHIDMVRVSYRLLIVPLE